MNNYEALKNRLVHCKPVTMSNLMVTSSPLLLNALTTSDCVLLDKEHGIYDSESLVPMTMQCRHLQFPASVRVEDSLYHLIAKALDLGADGIMLPRVERMEQLAAAIDAMHFPPTGRTGYGGWGLRRAGESLEDFQHDRILMVQIESVQGRELIPEMVEKYGDFIDAFIVGPNDYSFSLGLPRQTTHSKVESEIQLVFDLCRRLGKSCGCYSSTPALAKRYDEMGANVAWIGSDEKYLALGLHQYLDALPQVETESAVKESPDSNSY